MKEQLKTRVMDEVAILVNEQNFIAMAHARVSSVLQPFLPKSSCHAIAQDAVSDVVVKLFGRLYRLSVDKLESFFEENNLRAYLLQGVHNHALDRYRRWSGGSNSHNQSLEVVKPSAKNLGVRARVETDDINAVIDLSSFVEEDPGMLLDLQKLDHMLRERGLSDDEIRYIKMSLDGQSFKGMADQEGGTPDKYRKIISRALSKSGLNLDAFK